MLIDKNISNLNQEGELFINLQPHLDIQIKIGTWEQGLPLFSKENGHQQAQTKAIERRKHASKAIKMTADMVEFIDKKLSEHQWSPEQISGWLLEEKSIAISHERIYQHIWDDKKQGGDLYQYLRCQGKKYQKRGSE